MPLSMLGKVTFNLKESNGGDHLSIQKTIERVLEKIEVMCFTQVLSP
jgi:hypothetical protein